jgi:hypothetical protein
LEENYCCATDGVARWFVIGYSAMLASGVEKSESGRVSERGRRLGFFFKESFSLARVIFAKQGFECCVSFGGGIVFFKNFKFFFCFKLMF